MINIFLIILILLIVSHFLTSKIDSYYKNKSIKRWENACKIERNNYKNQYGYSPPGWEGE